MTRDYNAEWSVLTISVGLTGGLTNETPSTSFGGTLSHYPVIYQKYLGPTTYTSSEYNFENIFDNVKISEKTPGYVCYRALYLANYNGGPEAKTCYDVKLSVNTISAAGDYLYFGTDSVGKRTGISGATMSSISIETASPGSITWQTSGYTMSLGNLAPTEWIAVWLKHSTSASAPAKNDASFSIYINSGVV
jgi:hypothetical protein